jgi:lipoprotein-anchoring transpeptidase ErfK/SrfK
VAFRARLVPGMGVEISRVWRPSPKHPAALLVAGTGGSIGIHGTVDDALNRGGVKWTYGCISLLSADIQELYKIVPVGTPVVIQH